MTMTAITFKRDFLIHLLDRKLLELGGNGELGNFILILGIDHLALQILHWHHAPSNIA